MKVTLRGVILFICSIFISAFLQQNTLISVFNAPEGSIGLPLSSSRTQLTDSSHYFIISKITASNVSQYFHIQKHKTPELHTTKATNIYFGSVLFAGMLNELTQVLFSDSRVAVLAYFLVEGAILILMFSIALKIVCLNEQPLSYAIIFLAVLCALFIFDPFDVGSNFDLSWTRYAPLSIGGTSEVMRLTHPRLDWAYGFGYLSIFTLYLRSPSPKIFLLLLLLSLLFGLFSVSLTSIFGMATALYLFFFCEKKSSLLFVVAALCLSFLFCHYQVQQFLLTAKSKSFPIGHFTGINLRLFFLKYILLVVPVYYLMKDKIKYLLITIIFSCSFVGLISNCFYPAEIWSRGAAMLMWFIIITIGLIYINKYYYALVNNIFELTGPNDAKISKSDIVLTILFIGFIAEDIFPFSDHFVNGVAITIICMMISGVFLLCVYKINKKYKLLL